MRSLREYLTRTVDTRPEIGDREEAEMRGPAPRQPALKVPDRMDDFWLINASAQQATGPFTSYGHADKDRMAGEFVAVRVVLED